MAKFIWITSFNEKYNVFSKSLINVDAIKYISSLKEDEPQSPLSNSNLWINNDTCIEALESIDEIYQLIGFDDGIRVDVLSTHSASDVARLTAYAINGFQKDANNE